MIRMMRLDEGVAKVITPSSGDIAAALADPDGIFWLDLVEEPKENCHPILFNLFGFHFLAVDDALEETHVPKVDDWVSYLYIVLNDLHIDIADKAPLKASELDIFLGKNYIVTYQAHRMNSVEKVWEVCQKDDRVLAHGPGYLLYRIADELVEEYFPAVERIGDWIDEMEDAVFERPKQALLEQVFALKRAMLRVRRIIAPQREVLNKLSRGDFPVVAEEDRLYYRDIYDHFVRLYDITEGLRDLVGGVLDTYLSVVNNKMNEVMKALTIITTLFMPISFLTGFFGMNFFGPAIDLSAWTGRIAFGIMLVAFLAVPIGMYLYMRRREWM